MKITLFGTGYVGLVTGTCFSEMGNDVLCVDIDPEKVRALQRGVIPIYEPGLEDMVRRNQASGRLQFDTDIERGVQHGQLLFVAVGTPPDENGSADLKHVLAVAEDIGWHMQESKVIVGKSTVPVGTGDRIRQRVQQMLDDRDVRLEFGVVSNPEFLKEGAAVADFMKPDRIIVGFDRPQDGKLMEQLYAPFNRNHDKVMFMDIRSAELTKYAANAMLASRISLMNEFANLADRLGADIEAIRRGIGADPRIGHHFIYAGAGYGGFCFPKDVKALIRTGQEIGYATDIIASVERVNDRQKRVLLDKIEHHYTAGVQGRTFALWGLAFKPNTDDMREAPSLNLIAGLLAKGARIQAYDPAAMESARRICGDHPHLTFCSSRDEAVAGADALVVVTEWNEFRSPDFQQLVQQLRDRVIFDGRNLYDLAFLADQNIRYYSIGRPNHTGPTRPAPAATLSSSVGFEPVSREIRYAPGPG